MNSIQKAHRAFTIGTARIANSFSQSYTPVTRNQHRDAAATIVGSPLQAGATLRRGENIIQKVAKINHGTIDNLVKTDPTTFGLVRIVRQIVSQTPWEVVPDVSEEFNELDRWEDLAQDCVNKWGYTCEFDSRALTPEFINKVAAEVKAILRSGDDDRVKRQRISALFRIVKRELEQEAIYNTDVVRSIFNRPNNQSEKSFRALLELVTKDILIDDAGVIIKNYDVFGNLAELWTLPGYQINPIMYDDYTVPQPPNPAYVWRVEGMVKGWFNNSELTYIMANPQGTGYGMSPVEALVYIISATIMGDTKFIQSLQEGPIPPFAINLKEATEAQRVRFEQLLYEQMQKGAGNRALVLSGVPSEDGEFQFQELPRGMDFQKLQMMEYLKMAPAIKAFVFGFQATDLGLIEQANKGKIQSSDVMDILSQRRGIIGILTLIEEYVNSEIVKQEFPGINNVRFKFCKHDGDKPSIADQAKADSVAIASGYRTRNEVRARNHERPLPGGHIATIATGNAIVPLDVLDSVDFSQLDVTMLPGMNANNPAKAPKRNNANDRLQNNGNEPRG